MLVTLSKNLAKVAASIEERKKREAEEVPEALGALARDPQQVRVIIQQTSYPSRAPKIRACCNTKFFFVVTLTVWPPPFRFGCCFVVFETI